MTERLTELKLPTLKYRRIRRDMIEVYKLLTNKYDNNTETRPMWSEKVRRSLSLNLARQ